MSPIELSKRGHTIVVVDDNADLRLMLQRQLERAGYLVAVAGSVEAARQTLQKIAWDFVLLDRHLPDGDGMDLCAEIRKTRMDGYIMMVTGANAEDDKVQGFESGADDYVTKPFSIPELLARVRAGLRVVELQKALLETNRRLEEMSLTDELTQLRNRRAFNRELAQRFEAARRYSRPLSIATIDLDHFKQINDCFGHQTGDAVLQEIGRVLSNGTRMTDFAARVGGEEFSVLLTETALFEAIHFGEKIRAAVAAAPLAGIPLTVSVGVASMPHSCFASASEMVYAADQALYRAKFGGRNRVESEKRHERFARPDAALLVRRRPQAAS